MKSVNAACLLWLLGISGGYGSTDRIETTTSSRASIREEAAPVLTRWSFSFESAFTFEVIPNPWRPLWGDYAINPLDYKLATQIVSARYQLSEPDGPLFLRGYLELTGGLVATAIVEGPESYFFGGVLGFRYNFVQPGWRLIPYFEARGGPGITDARVQDYTQQQDFTFTYLIGAGLRYEINSRCSVNIGAIDQHMSNFYLAERNFGFDSIGVSVGFQYRY